MKLRPIYGVLAVACALLFGTAGSIIASDKPMFTGSHDCCVLVDGQCVPCDGFAAESTAPRSISATLASATCDGPCVPMTPEECAAIGCVPRECDDAGTAGLTPNLSRFASATETMVGCDGKPCVPMPGCGSGSGCATNATAMTLVGLRNAETGAVTYVTLPVSSVRAMLAEDDRSEVHGDI